MNDGSAHFQLLSLCYVAFTNLIHHSTFFTTYLSPYFVYLFKYFFFFFHVINYWIDQNFSDIDNQMKCEVKLETYWGDLLRHDFIKLYLQCHYHFFFKMKMLPWQPRQQLDFKICYPFLDNNSTLIAICNCILCYNIAIVFRYSRFPNGIYTHTFIFIKVEPQWSKNEAKIQNQT